MTNERTIAGVNGDGGSENYIRGDHDPTKFKYTDSLNRDTYLSLLLRNPKIQKATVWVAGEMIRERWLFDKDQPVNAPKHGETIFAFPTFNSWLEWMGFMQELLKVFIWSLTFADSIMVFFTGTEVISKEMTLGPLTPGETYVKCQAYYPITKGSGYQLEQVNPLYNKPEMYTIRLKAHKGDSLVMHVPASRVVRFPAPALELKYGGTSTISAIAHDAIAQEQIKRGIVSMANNLLPGIMGIKAADEDEAALIDSILGDTLSHLNKVHYKNIEDIDGLIKLIIPDIKITQFSELNKILNDDIATGANISESVMVGAPQGAISSSWSNIYATYTNIKQFQAHYKRPVEEAFFMLGKLDTEFTWIDPTPAPPPTNAPDKDGVDNDGDNPPGENDETETKQEEVEE